MSLPAAGKASFRVGIGSSLAMSGRSGNGSWRSTSSLPDCFTDFMPDEPSSLAVHIAIHLHDQGWTHPPVDRTDEGYKQFYLNMARAIDQAIKLAMPIKRRSESPGDWDFLSIPKD